MSVHFVSQLSYKASHTHNNKEKKIQKQWCLPSHCKVHKHEIKITFLFLFLVRIASLVPPTWQQKNSDTTKQPITTNKINEFVFSIMKNDVTM